MKKQSKSVNAYFDLLKITSGSKSRTFIKLSKCNKFIKAYVFNTLLIFLTTPIMVTILVSYSEIVSIIGFIFSLIILRFAYFILHTSHSDYIGPILTSNFVELFTEGSFCTLKYGKTSKFDSYSFSFGDLTQVDYYKYLGFIRISASNVLHKSNTSNEILESIKLEIPLTFKNNSDVLQLFLQYCEESKEHLDNKYYLVED